MSTLSSPLILVTGGLGFVGINLGKALAELPQAQVILADLAQPSEAMQQFLAPAGARVSFAQLDVTDRESLRGLVTEAGVTHLVHAAAITASPAQEAARPTLVVDVNLGGAVNALDVALTSPTVQRVVMVSSSGVYAPPQQSGPVDEDHPLDRGNLYSVTKRNAELLAERYAAISGKPMISVRLASVYGPMEQPKSSRTHVSLVQRLVDATRADQPVRLYGPHVSRDWVHAGDVGRAIARLLTAPRLSHTVYNISSGLPTPFGELAEHFVPHGLCPLWVKKPQEAEIAQEGSHARAPLSITRLLGDTGMTPADFRPLDQGIREMFVTSL
jgi:nucleoside-diphosphate-sugar epimerase